MEDSKLFIKGKIINILPLESGQGSGKSWKKQSYILLTTQFDKKVCFSVWGDKIDEFQIKEGSILTVHINIESREYNGRWYTDIRAWKVEKSDYTKSEESSPSEKTEEDPFLNNDIGDLPF